MFCVRLVIALSCLAMLSHAAVADDQATQFFTSHPNAIDVQQQDNMILFANRQVGLAFRQSDTGFELTRLYDVANQQELLTERTSGEPRDVFQVRMALDPKFVRRDDRGTTRDTKIGGLIERMAELGEAFIIGSHEAKSTAWSHDVRDDEAVLRLQWQGIDVKKEAGVLNVEVTITLRANDPLSSWRFSVRNRATRNGIERVRLPILSLAPIGEKQRNVFIYPKWRGGYLADPFNGAAGLGENYHTTGAYYPYYTNMQFWALYNQDSQHGVYLGTQDPTPHMHHYLVDNKPDQIAWSVSHFPSNMSFAGEDFELTYDCVVGPFKGDWYDASQMYRAWAIKQSWTAKGPLATREDVPKWYRESPLFFYTILNDSATGSYSMAENLQFFAAQFRQWLDWAGVPLASVLYTWQDYDPSLAAANIPSSSRRDITIKGHRWFGFPLSYSPFGNYPAIAARDDLAETVEQLRQHGGIVTPYVCLQVYDPGPTNNAPYATEAQHHMIRDSYGAMMTYPGMNSWFPCVADKWWRQRMVETARILVEQQSVGGFYLDVMHGIGIPCFWTPHGHAHGGGSTMTEGMHGLVGQIRSAMKEAAPDTIITGESSCENMIDVIDGVMYQYTQRPENVVPLFGTVYNDYIVRHGRELSVARPNDFYIECASLFVEGAQIGRLRLRPRSGVLMFDDPQHEQMIAFLGRMVGYYKQEVGRKFLSYGQLLRPLIFETPSPMPLLLHGEEDAKSDADHETGATLTAGQRRHAALQSGVFRARDGSVGVFIVNISADEMTFAASLDPADYELRGAYDVVTVTPTGETQQFQAKTRDSVVLSGVISAREITMFVLQPSRR